MFCVICPLTKFFKVFNSLILSVCFCCLAFSQQCSGVVRELLPLDQMQFVKQKCSVTVLSWHVSSKPLLLKVHCPSAASLRVAMETLGYFLWGTGFLVAFIFVCFNYVGQGPAFRCLGTLRLKHLGLPWLCSGELLFSGPEETGMKSQGFLGLWEHRSEAGSARQGPRLDVHLVKEYCLVLGLLSRFSKNQSACQHKATRRPRREMPSAATGPGPERRTCGPPCGTAWGCVHGSHMGARRLIQP